MTASAASWLKLPSAWPCYSTTHRAWQDAVAAEFNLLLHSYLTALDGSGAEKDRAPTVKGLAGPRFYFAASYPLPGALPHGCGRLLFGLPATLALSRHSDREESSARLPAHGLAHEQVGGAGGGPRA